MSLLVWMDGAMYGDRRCKQGSGITDDTSTKIFYPTEDKKCVLGLIGDGGVDWYVMQALKNNPNDCVETVVLNTLKQLCDQGWSFDFMLALPNYTLGGMTLKDNRLEIIQKPLVETRVYGAGKWEAMAILAYGKASYFPVRDSSMHYLFQAVASIESSVSEEFDKLVLEQ